ncbi:MAG: S41 family peptidase [Patescibacteria group bacterium]|nr:S41 family peptidase [Patescibacteria group bacterium]MDE2590784.1 S41 family peptidase [Patescibacteria group bacterium]
MRLNKLQLGLIVLIAFFLGILGGSYKVKLDWLHYAPQLQVISKEPPSGLTTVDMTPFWDVWQRVQQMYYDKSVVDPKKMLNGAISGMVSSLGDPYTMYLPPAQQTNFQQQMAGKFEGIGAELATKDKSIIVVAPLDGSPAQKSGMKAGDTIVKVDGVSTDGWTLPQAVDKIRGPKGTSVSLGIVHKGSQTVTTVSIVRDTITVKSVAGWVKPIKDIEGIDNAKFSDQSSEIMYVRLSQFGDATNQDWVALVDKLSQQAQKDGNVKGMVFDLRNNPGGYLTDATFIAGEFLPVGTSVVTEDDGNGNTDTLSVSRKGELLDMPLVVLINGGSASASEIVSGALRDHNRAKLVGDQSFGKGTVQQAVDLGEGAGLHVTVAKWLTPNGIWVHGKGLTPDVKVALDPNDASHDTQLEAAIQELLK